MIQCVIIARRHCLGQSAGALYSVLLVPSHQATMFCCCSGGWQDLDLEEDLLGESMHLHVHANVYNYVHVEYSYNNDTIISLLLF